MRGAGSIARAACAHQGNREEKAEDLGVGRKEATLPHIPPHGHFMLPYLPLGINLTNVAESLSLMGI